MRKTAIGTDVNQVEIKNLSGIQGQPQVIDTLKVHLRAHFNINAASDHTNLSFGPVILCGPSGVGKTMTARAIHSELGNLTLAKTNGVALNDRAELFSILIKEEKYHF